MWRLKNIVWQFEPQIGWNSLETRNTPQKLIPAILETWNVVVICNCKTNPEWMKMCLRGLFPSPSSFCSNGFVNNQSYAGKGSRFWLHLASARLWWLLTYVWHIFRCAFLYGLFYIVAGRGLTLNISKWRVLKILSCVLVTIFPWCSCLRVLKGCTKQ